MFSWGEQSPRGFRLKDTSHILSNYPEDRAAFLDLDFLITDLSAGLRVLSFVKTNGDAFFIRVHQKKDGTSVRGKQISVQWKEKIQSVACTDDVVLLLSNKGQVIYVDTNLPPFKPRLLRALRSFTVTQVSCGSKHSLALTKDGQVLTWGVGSRGQLGLGKRRPEASSPQPLKSLSDLPLVQVCAGGEHSLGLTVSGAVFSWGSNSCGQLGLGHTTDIHTPTLLHHLNLKKSCHISSGEAHTAVLTEDGLVFTFGAGQNGQLGHNSFRNELRPRLVAELWGSKVTQVACGRQHTLVLTEAQKTYSFGSGAKGQLGREQTSPAVPLPVQFPHEYSDCPSIIRIFAGENCSFAVCSSQDTDTKSNCDAGPTLSNLINTWTSDSELWKQTKQDMLWMFSSASCLNRSFLDCRKHFETSSRHCGLDLTAAQSSFAKLLNSPQVLREVEAVSIRLLQSLNKSPLGVEALRVYLLLTELLHVLHKNKQEHEDGTALGQEMAAVICRLSEDNFKLLGQWWASLPYATRVRHVEAWKNAPGNTDNDLKNILQVLQQMYNINNQEATGPERIPESVFCTPIPTDVIKDMLLWHLDPNKNLEEPPILCCFSFIMDLKAKKDALYLNRTVRGNSTNLAEVPIFEVDLSDFDFEEELYNGFDYSDFYFDDDDYLFTSPFTLKLRRECAMEDTFKQLAFINSSHFKKDLIVYFNGITIFDNVNQKDFFHLVFHEMVSAESGMFMFNDSATLAWFPSRPSHPVEHYFLFGVLCGVAIFNLHIIFLPFPLALYKKLLGVRPSLDDLCQFSPCTGQALRCLLEEYSDEVIDSLDMDFRIHWDGTEVNLDPNTLERRVTGQNKEEFVEAFVDHVLTSSVQREFEEFSRGFFEACDRHLVKLFIPEQLQGIMVGQDFSNWDQFKQSTVYEGIFQESHPTILMFWEVFDELKVEQKKALLWFVTGFESVPILSEKKIMTIRQMSYIKGYPEDQYYPKSHTCTNDLYLPLYSTKEIMKNKLTESLAQISSRQ